MEYKMTIKRQLNIVLSGLPLYVISIGVLGFIIWNLSSGNLNETLVVVIISLLPVLLPFIIIHINYYYKSKGIVININKFSETIQIINGKHIAIYGFKNIKDIIVLKGLYYKLENESDKFSKIIFRPMALPWSDYGYLKIIFDDGKLVNITIFMFDLKTIPFETYKRKYMLLPLIM